MTGIDAADLPLVASADVIRLQAALAAVGRGEQEALGELFDACGADLYGLALCRTGHVQDAEDVVQEVFVRLARTRVSLGRVRNPRSYLLGMAHRAAIDVLRRRRCAVELDAGLLEATCVDQDRRRGRGPAGCAPRRAARHPARGRVAAALRRALVAEIGDVTEVPTFTAASRYRLGIARLRRRLGVES